MSINKSFQGHGYNKKDFVNMFLPGTPTVPTPALNSNNLEIVNTLYLNNSLALLKNNILNSIVNNANDFVHVDEPVYYISEYQNIIIDGGSMIYLPILTSDGISINIVNNSGTSITINSQDNQLIHSGFYIKPGGSSSFVLDAYKIAKLINIHKNNIFSWVLLLS